MDETREELEQLRQEAARIDVYKYRKRMRALAAVLTGALLAGVVWVALEAKDRARNPCLRVHDYLCSKGESSPACLAYAPVLDESINDPSAEIRSRIRAQCERKIERLKEEEGVTVP
jgi:hypothetical protein